MIYYMVMIGRNGQEHGQKWQKHKILANIPRMFLLILNFSIDSILKAKFLVLIFSDFRLNDSVIWSCQIFDSALYVFHFFRSKMNIPCEDRFTHIGSGVDFWAKCLSDTKNWVDKNRELGGSAKREIRVILVNWCSIGISGSFRGVQPLGVG